MTKLRPRRNQTRSNTIRCAVYTRINVGSKLAPLREQRRAIRALLAAQKFHGWVRRTTLCKKRACLHGTTTSTCR